MDIITVEKLTKRFAHSKAGPGFIGALKGIFHRKKSYIDAVKDVSFTVKKGEFIGFLGPNGAGKTTTLKMLAGILHPTTGHATVLGHTPWKRDHALQKRFALVMGQKNQLWWDLPVQESFDFNRVLYEIPKDQYTKQVAMLTILLEIEHLLQRPVRKLSLGERMKCELAAALLHRPDILFLDEPTIGLDVISQKNIREFLGEYNKTEKATIILTSHYMEDIRRLCERVIIIDHGALLYDGEYRTLVEQYADTKTIEITFTEAVESTRLKHLGVISEDRRTSMSLTIPRSRITMVTTELLEKFPVEDISIHEESMEEIVSEIFQGTKPHT